MGRLSLSISGTSALTATVGAAFPTLAVRVRGPGGEPIAGVAVTFAALGAAGADLGGDVIATATTGSVFRSMPARGLTTTWATKPRMGCQDALRGFVGAPAIRGRPASWLRGRASHSWSA